MEFDKQASSATSFSKKITNNGGGLSGKHVYDGVFGGHQAKVGHGVEDYREIFGGSGTCPIPVLDVPELTESNKAWVDAQRKSSRLDYANIFGGFGDADFGVAYDELFAEQKKVKKNSFKEARPPVEARSRYAGLEHSYSSEEKQVPSPETSVQSLDGAKQFNVSYHKTNPGNKNGTTGATHIAKLHAIPGYTCLIDETSPSQKGQVGKPVRSVLNDAHLNVNVSEGMKAAGKSYRKAVSGPQPSGTAKNTPRSPFEFQKKSSRNRSFSNDMLFDAFEIGLGTHPSRMPQLSGSPPNLGSNKGVSSISMNSKFGVCRSDASEGAAGSYSPPLLDEEVDANSAAAASAAAVRKAIEEAQAKIKIAKELMERKKEGLQSRGKMSFNNGLNAQKREVKTVERANRSEAKEDREMLEKEDTPKQVFAGLSGLNEMKARQTTPDLKDEKSSTATSAVGVTNSTESKLTQADTRLEEAEDGQTTEEFFECADTEEERDKALEFEQADITKKITSSTNENEWKEKTAEENIKKLKECGNKLKEFEEALKQENVECELNSVEGAFEWDMHANNIKSAQELHQEEENGEKTSADKHGEADQTLEASYNQEKCENKLKMLQEPEENSKFQIWESDKNKVMKELKGAHDWVETEKKQKEAYNQEEMENRSDEVSRRQENERRLDEIDRQKESEKEHKEAGDRIGCEEPKKEGWNQEEDEKKQNDAPRREETEEKSGEVHKLEEINVRSNHQQGNEESEQGLGEDDGKEGNEMLEEANENEKILKGDYHLNGSEMRQEKNCEGAETERVQSEICQRAEDEKNMETSQQALSYQGNKFEAAYQGNKAEDEKNMEATQQVLRYQGNKFEAAYQGNKLEAADDLYELDANENLGRTDKTCGHRENFENVQDVEVSAEVLALDENERIVEVTEASLVPEETGKESNDLEEEENCETAGLAQGFIRLDGIKKQMADTTEAFIMGKNGVYFCETDLNFENEQNEHDETEHKRVCHQEKCIEEMIWELDENDEDANEPEVGTNNEENENNFVPFHEERWLGNGIESLCDPEKHVEEVACEMGVNYRDAEESEVATNHADDESSFESSHEERWVDNGIDIEPSQQPCTLEGQGNTKEIPQEERTSQSTCRHEENHHETLTTEEKEAKDLQKEGEVEKKQRSKMEEAKEREMEKEKERIVVERAIREARERAFAEARERAEKAAVERAATEAHQRLMAEARERLEKSAAEANDKSTAEKASMEAKLKAERAAVERATAEARERALEKALSEKAAFKARSQAEKFAAEKFSGVSKDDGINSSDQQYKESGPSSSSRCPSSSNHGVTYSTERSTGANGESAQRCNARLERHQRTAERASKALAEKNMRDLLAQKEQTERNRIAEALDADVKRWSSGKERNLRALLSTLQYILGPDSGWQAIPLTDLISTTAVKKAYRKATLFVHPDKLQQRGASIQQKYTCEKVFDLLKEAWNKFSAEER